MKRPILALSVVATTAFFAVIGCGETKPPPGPTTTAAAPPQRGGAAAAAAVAAAMDSGAPAAKVEEYSENDFVENDRNRDPFHSFVKSTSSSKSPVASQIKGILGDYSVDELKLSAIVMSAEGPLAMIVDPARKGWTVKKGDYVGRAETVHTGGQNGADYFLTWRVDRIREGDIVFVREDRANPAVPPATRVVALHQESDKDQNRSN